MYVLSDDIITLFKKNQKQVAKLTITLKDNNVLNLTESSLVQGGLTIDRYCVSGKKLEFGTAISSELTLTLNNSNSQFDSIDFNGANIKVEIGIKDWSKNDPITFIPCGYFIIDEISNKKSTKVLKGLDYMTKFDKDANRSFFYTNRTLKFYIEKCCEKCDVVLATDLSHLPNYGIGVPHFPYANLTYRQVLQYCCEAMGCSAFIDWDGKLQVVPFGSNSLFTIDTSDRYTSKIVNSVNITGVRIIDSGVYYDAGDVNYAFVIKDNLIIQQLHNTIANNIYNSLLGGSSISYLPFSCTCKSYPFLYPLDKITYIDNRTNINTISYITNITYKINANMSMISKGELDTQNDYANIPVPYITASDFKDSNSSATNGVVSIVDGTVTADFVNALGITAKKIEIKDSNNNTIFKADSDTHSVEISGGKIDIGLLSGNSSIDYKSFRFKIEKSNTEDAAEIDGTTYYSETSATAPFPFYTILFKTQLGINMNTLQPKLVYICLHGYYDNYDVKRFEIVCIDDLSQLSSYSKTRYDKSWYKEY